MAVFLLVMGVGKRVYNYHRVMIIVPLLFAEMSLWGASGAGSSGTVVYSSRGTAHVRSDDRAEAKKERSVPVKAVVRKTAASPEKKYVVGKNDTLYGLSRKFNVDIDSLCRINRFTRSSPIYPGQVILVPAESASVDDNSRFSWPVAQVREFRKDAVSPSQTGGIVIVVEDDTRVLSSAEGKVTRIGSMRGYGQYVVITHADNYLTVYSHLVTLSVREGQQVKAHQVIGTLEGRRSSLHFQIGKSRKLLDPSRYLPEAPRSITRK